MPRTQSNAAWFKSDQLESLARQLAESHAAVRIPKRVASVMDRLPECEERLRAAYRYFARASEAQVALSYAAEWMLDNFYVVEQTLRQIREDMPPSYYRQLPKLDAPPSQGQPRVYALASEIIRYCDCHLDLDWTARFVRVYQRVTPLTMGELWALPTMLRLGVLEVLARAVTAIVALQTSRGEENTSALVSGMEEEAIVANCIISLRALAMRDWKAFFESVSLVEEILCSRDPVDVYARMDFETRDRYRGVIEEIARATGKDEEQVAWEAVMLAQAEAPKKKGALRDAPRTAHIGYYLLDAGRRLLEERLGYRPSRLRRLGRWALVHPTLVYLGGVLLITLPLMLGLVSYAFLAGGSAVQLVAVGLLTLLPVSAIAVGLVNWIVTQVVPPRLLPRMDFQKGIPADFRSVVVIPVLLSAKHADEAGSLLQQLELHFLGNTDPHLAFALLTDFEDAPQKHLPGEEKLIEEVKEGVRALNKKYGPPLRFYHFHRDREWNPSEGCWMGWERKRGKLVEFNRLLRGKKSALTLLEGDPDGLQGVKYVITLDADTILPRDSAQRLIATMAHPLNRAEFDPQGGTVVAGYTVLQPRLGVSPLSAGRSLFARVFSGDAGLDLYTRAVSDVYQDLFGEGIYAGKGIYDVAAFERSLENRVPENALLSHDLFEGVHGRAGLVTDVVFYEDYPSHYLAHTRRLHRWVRGDWQLLPWLFPRVPDASGKRRKNTLSVIDRWKMLDNMRRSLLTPMTLFLLLAGWLVLPGSALLWTFVAGLGLAVPVLVGLLIALRRGLGEMRASAQTVKIAFLRWLLVVTFLPYESLILLDAILSTLIRLAFTRKKLLQWTTAAHTIRLFGRQTQVGLIWRQMIVASMLAFLLELVMVLAGRPIVLLVAQPFLFMWLVSPYVALSISRPITPEREMLSEDQVRQLRRLARRTWLYFERFVGPEDQWLPPDHYQEDPLGIVAHRTSPTNIGLHLLSVLAAYDMGYAGALDLVLRLRPTFESLAKLERHRGHFLNWYDTHNLKPLPPRYVSVVDSGNLAVSLLAFRQGCLALTGDPVLRWQRWQGFLDTLDVLAETVEGVRDRPGLRLPAEALLDYLEQLRLRVLATREDPSRWISLLDRLGDDAWQELERLLIALVESGLQALDPAVLRDMRVWSERVSAHLISLRAEIDILLPWLVQMNRPPILFLRSDLDPLVAEAWHALVGALPAVPRLGELAAICRDGQESLRRLQKALAERYPEPAQDEAVLVREAQEWSAKLASELYSARMAAESLLIGLQDLSGRAEAYFQEMGFGFLFDPQRQVFHIGYNVESGMPDGNYYDLLASEARIASLLAIARGDVPQSHWLHLARPITQVDGARVLISWGGTMFEYLMPTLVVRHYAGTLLEQSCRAAVSRQIHYGRQKGVPWGISESGYYRFDAGKHYQYRGFGVPGLGFRRGLSEDLVIAPYASLLALPLFPSEVMRNIARLVRLNMVGCYGFYEAIDFTRSRLPRERKNAIIRSYMVHHHGMSLVAMDNYLHDDVMVRRVHADPRVQSVELLLLEGVSRRAPVEYPHPEEALVLRPPETTAAVAPWRPAPNTPMPQVHVLSNGRYTVFVSHTGSGYSRWQEIDLTRWRADATLDDWGIWFYVKDLESGDIWSATHQPVGASASQEVLFYAHKAEFHRRDYDISLHLEITVHPEDDVEIRRIALTNHTDRPRRLMLVSYGELALAPLMVDLRHPAFNKLFIEGEYVADLNALLFRRRPRSAKEEPVYLAHLLTSEEGRLGASVYEWDRGRFLGRGGSVRSPAFLSSQMVNERGEAESGPIAPLDPIMSIGQEIELRPHGRAQVAYVTLAASSRQEALELAQRYRSWPRLERVFDSARSFCELELRRLNLMTAELENIQQLLSALLYPHETMRASPLVLASNSKGQSGLWSFGISGDYPILLARIGDQEEMDLVIELLQAHAYWRARQIKIDLVILNERESSYDQELQGQILRLVTRMGSDGWLNQRGGIFVLRADQMSESERTLLDTAARVVLEGRRGRLGEQVRRMRRRSPRLPRFVPTLASPDDLEPTPPLPRPEGLLFDNGLGGFSPDGREYVIYLEPGQTTPAPWINVVANSRFGFLVSEAGSGYTWSENSGENRLTPWNNDPVSDRTGEALYLRDEETAVVWSPTPLPAAAPAAYLVRHGAGYSIFDHHSHGLKQRLLLFVVRDAPVKVVRLRLENTWNRVRRITATFYVEWVLGGSRDWMQQYIVPEFDVTRHALLARNPYNEGFGERVAFAVASQRLHGLTADRAEFLGRRGEYARPAALERVGLSGTVRAGLDPCAALQVHLDLYPGEAHEIFFLLGQGVDRQEALALIDQYQDPVRVEAAWQEAVRAWDELLGAVTVRTPDAAMNLMLNRWLLYQTLSCRIWGRSALYQSSGAFGYRDQLQDVMALVHAAPELTRAFLLEAARRQFEMGDVLHWWHPPSGHGVRTRCSDDMLWLPFATTHYVAATGDVAVLDESAPFLRGDPLDQNEMERYGHYKSSAQSATLYEHCRRAVEQGMTSGPHGLPLIGSHDWNDGLNRVGIGGRGESVWLGWFLYDVLRRFIPLCERRGDTRRAALYRQRLLDLRRALEDNAWDWGWYRRAYYDDGSPLGSSESRECQIDSLAQSWAVLSGAADPKRAIRAMEAVVDRLVRWEDRLILLFTPPFDKTERDPGYIKGYPPGVRENGGQYTHAAVWVAWAFTLLGQGDRAEALFRLLLPVYHADMPEKVARYRVEPYVVAADIYSAPPYVGRGGWTWYTGSAGWMYRLGLEAILGVRRTGNVLRIEPCIPKQWSEYEIAYRYGRSIYRIRVTNPDGVNQGVRQVILDGQVLPTGEIPLDDDGRDHEVRVAMIERRYL